MSDASQTGNFQEQLNGLLAHQQQLRNWSADIEQKIFELEESYLEETPGGNIVRGWDLDSKAISIRPRLLEDKERIFSFSSYQVWMENRSITENDPNESRKSLNPRAEPLQPTKSKKSRKSGSSKRDGAIDEWDEDYQ